MSSILRKEAENNAGKGKYFINYPLLLFNNKRWHNHLNPDFNKAFWTEREEAILFKKQMELGNKWSKIAVFLPGRTDNCIKNHFYSKLRKYIRKLFKALIKENKLKEKNVVIEKYNSDILYKIVKDNKIPYYLLNKENLFDVILKSERNFKINRNFYFPSSKKHVTRHQQIKIEATDEDFGTKRLSKCINYNY